jgi:hypothetical protein
MAPAWKSFMSRLRSVGASRRPGSSNNDRRKQRRTLFVEPLEDRTVPSSVVTFAVQYSVDGGHTFTTLGSINPQTSPLGSITGTVDGLAISANSTDFVSQGDTAFQLTIAGVATSNVQLVVQSSITGLPTTPPPQTLSYNFSGNGVPSATMETWVDQSNQAFGGALGGPSGVNIIADTLPQSINTVTGVSSTGTVSLSGNVPYSTTTQISSNVPAGDLISLGDTNTILPSSIPPVTVSLCGYDYLVPNTTTPGSLTTSTTGIPIPGTTVTLTGTDEFGNPVNESTTTGGTGYYCFMNLNPSNSSGYTVTETPPSIYNHVGQTSTTLGANTNTPPGTPSVTSNIVLTSGTSTDNFFESATVSVCGFDYLVSNTTTPGSLTTSTTGVPIPGTTVTLTGTDDFGNPINESTTTSGTGYYCFMGLNPSNSSGYTVNETPPSGDTHLGQTSTTPGAVTTPSSTPVVSNIVVTTTGTMSTDNFFETSTVSVCGFDYLVSNTTPAGSLTTGTTGIPIPGTTVTLTGTDEFGNPVNESTTTSGTGYYCFMGLNPSNPSGYTVTETPPSGDTHLGQTSTTPGAVTTPSSTPVVSQIVVTTTGTMSTDNFFETASVTITGFDYLVPPTTTAGDLTTSTTGTPIPGTTVTLSGDDAFGNDVNLTTTTNGGGQYTFSGLNPSNSAGYSVTEVPPAADTHVGQTSTTVGAVTTPPTSPIVSNIVLTTNNSPSTDNFFETTGMTLTTSPSVNTLTTPTLTTTPSVVSPPAACNDNFYPFASSNALTNVAFNESQIFAGSLPGDGTTVSLSNGHLDVFYNDETAMTLGVSQVTIQTAGGSTTTNYSVSPMGTTDSGGASSVTNPSVGAPYTPPTNLSTVTPTSLALQGGTDPQGRPFFPSLYVTDITGLDPNSLAAHGDDWQFGGSPVAPSAVFGTWKSATETINDTNPSSPQFTITEAANPTQNNWDLDGGTPAPASIQAASQGQQYSSDLQWNLSGLTVNGQPLITGHSYRFYFIIHDGDQNHQGGDVGQGCIDVLFTGSSSASGTYLTDSATLAGGNNPGGNLSFYLMPSGATSSTPLSSAIYTDKVPVSGNGTYPTGTGTITGSNLVTAPGIYQWVVVYSGDNNNTPLTSPFGAEPDVVNPPPCPDNLYPFASSNVLTDVAFNESAIFAGSLPGDGSNISLSNGHVDVFYNDETAMTLGVSQVTTITSSGTTTANYSVSPMGTTDSGGASSVMNPSVGAPYTPPTQSQLSSPTFTPTQLALQGGTDPEGRPFFPSLYITDLTSNLNSTNGDWQQGGMAIAPSAVFGTWKSATETINETNPSNPQFTVNVAQNPTQNNWDLDGGTPAPASIQGASQGQQYSADLQWNLSSLTVNGQPLIAGHTYRLYFIIHDGDQNHQGGDVGQGCINLLYTGSQSPTPTPPTGMTVGGTTTRLMDSATLSNGNNPGGTITFYLLPPGSTSSTPLSSAVYTDVVQVSGTGTYSTAMGNNPGGYQPTQTGTYEWVVIYSGDMHNPGAVSGFGAESQMVTLATPGISTNVGITSTPPAACNDNFYPFASSNNALTNVAFNESQIFAGSIPGDGTAISQSNGHIDVFYNDETAMTLGVSQVTIQTASGTTTKNYSVSAMGTTDSGGASAVTNPSVGAPYTPPTNLNTVTPSSLALQGGTDPNGRPLFPSLYVTDISGLDPNSLAAHGGDWQLGGSPLAPSAVFGTWKSATETINETNPSNPQFTINVGPNPAQNNWDLDGGTAAPASIQAASQGQQYSTDLQWNLSSITVNGQPLIPGHSYRFYFIIHDGDQNHQGGDVGQGCIDVLYSGPSGSITPTTAPVSLGSGNKLADAATLTGGNNPGSFLTFYLLPPGSTSSTPLTSAVYTDVVPTSGNGTYTTSMGNNPGGYLPTAASASPYQWVVTFSGDSNNTPATTTFGSEPQMVTAPNLVVTKVADQSTITAGQTAGYVVTISNTGNGAATGVTLSDPLPSGAANDITWAIDNTANTGNFVPGDFVITNSSTPKPPPPPPPPPGSPPSGPAAPPNQTLSLVPGVTTLNPGQTIQVHITGLTTPADATGGLPLTGSGSVAANFNPTAIPYNPVSGQQNYIWFDSVISPAGLPKSGTVTINFTNQVIAFSYTDPVTHATVNQSVPVPNATLTISSSNTQASTYFNTTTNSWVTSVPLTGPGNDFLSGLAFKVPVDGLPGGIQNVTWSGTFVTNTTGVSLNWQWAATVFNNFSNNYNALNVKPLDAKNVTVVPVSPESFTAYSNGDHAGTPEAFNAPTPPPPPPPPPGPSGATAGTLSPAQQVTPVSTTGLLSNTATLSATGAAPVQVTASITLNAAPLVVPGDFAQPGFWTKPTGQGLINALNGSSSATGLAHWMVTNFPNLYGSGAGNHALISGSNYFTNSQVVTAYQQKFGGADQHTLAAAISIYATSTTLSGINLQSLDGNFNSSVNGSGGDYYNVAGNGAAFGLPNNSWATVLQLLQDLNANTSPGGPLGPGVDPVFNGIDTTGNVAAQLASGSSSTASTDLGELLGWSGLQAGTIRVAADVPQGPQATAEQSAIAAAIASLDAQLSPFGINLVEVPSDQPAQIHIGLAASSLIGGANQGVLGTFTVDGNITLVSNWNWYLGSIPSGIAPNQYDFQTVVTHELGHVLGLGESSDPSSVMYLYLDPGQVKHGLAASDLQAIGQELDAIGSNPTMATPGLVQAPANGSAGFDQATVLGSAVAGAVMPALVGNQLPDGAASVEQVGKPNQNSTAAGTSTTSADSTAYGLVEISNSTVGTSGSVHVVVGQTQDASAALTSTAIYSGQVTLQLAFTMPAVQLSTPNSRPVLDDVFAGYTASRTNALAANAITGVSTPSGMLAIPSSLLATQIGNSTDILGLSLFTPSNDDNITGNQSELQTAIDEVFSNEMATYDHE